MIPSTANNPPIAVGAMTRKLPPLIAAMVFLSSPLWGEPSIPIVTDIPSLSGDYVYHTEGGFGQMEDVVYALREVNQRAFPGFAFRYRIIPDSGSYRSMAPGCMIVNSDGKKWCNWVFAKIPTPQYEGKTDIYDYYLITIRKGSLSELREQKYPVKSVER